MKKMDLAFKTDQQCVDEIDAIISGKNRSRNAWIVRRFITARKLAGDSPDLIRMMLIREYKLKYGALQRGEQTPEEMLEQSKKEIKEFEEGSKNGL